MLLALLVLAVASGYSVAAAGKLLLPAGCWQLPAVIIAGGCQLLLSLVVGVLALVCWHLFAHGFAAAAAVAVAAAAAAVAPRTCLPTVD